MYIDSRRFLFEDLMHNQWLSWEIFDRSIVIILLNNEFVKEEIIF